MRAPALPSIMLLVAACQAERPAETCETPLAEQVETDALLEHLEQLQTIADDHDGTRAAGTSGYVASVEYVTTTLEEAGYDVRRETFEFSLFEEATPSVLETVDPAPAAHENGVDFVTAVFSAAGDVTAAASPVDLELGLDNASTSGCEAEDFDGFEAGHIAILQRGECTFSTKATNADEAGASAVLIFNQGDTEDRTDVFPGTLGAGNEATIPVVLTTYALGDALAQMSADGLVLHVVVDAKTIPTTDDNVIAESAEGDPAQTIMLGAHLDSVLAGPGINDNGSGTAILLETAHRLTRCNPTNRVRFAWWGAEELGLIGSSEYVSGLNEQEVDELALYLNFDMVASPNFVHFVYDADGSTYDFEAPPGSAAAEDILRKHLGEMGVEPRDAPLNGRSDYWGFMAAGVAVGGAFTGAEGNKTQAQAEEFGGEADAPFDGCYHAACDRTSNVAVDALEQNARAAASTVEELAGDASTLGR